MIVTGILIFPLRVANDKLVSNLGHPGQSSKLLTVKIINMNLN